MAGRHESRAAGRENDWQRRQPPSLFLQQAWFVRLRWVAGAAVIAGGALDGYWLGWYRHGRGMLLIGAVILVYNVALWGLLGAWQRAGGGRRGLLALAWGQIAFDLICLTHLTVWTGGYSSPLLGFYVFHMVFASLLLSRFMAYLAAALAITLVEGTLVWRESWPATQPKQVAFVAWAVMLLATVHLANHITRNLRAKRRRLVGQNRRIRAMTERLKRQQDLMVQHEKMVAMGRMAAGVAHEIANPLASMDSLLQLMERKPEKERPDAVATLREQIARINTIVRQMTSLAHPGEGQWVVGSLNEVAGRALEVIAYDPRLKGVELVEHWGADLPLVRMLSADIQQVVINLVLNALDAVEGVAGARVSVRTAAEGPGRCVIEVADNGRGVLPEHRQRLFEPFFTTKEVGRGTGLGLSISYTLVRKHGGELAVASEPGKGAVFTVRLPAAGGGGSQGREGPVEGIAVSERRAI